MAASTNGGAVLELGTGTGLSTAWLLDGLARRGRLLSVDNDARVVEIARRTLGGDERLELQVKDGAELITELCQSERQFDLVFADTWPGKYNVLEEALSLLKVGGCYVIDDMLPQANWPADHPPKVKRLLHTLAERDDLVCVPMEWSSGIVLAYRSGEV